MRGAGEDPAGRNLVDRVQRVHVVGKPADGGHPPRRSGRWHGSHPGRQESAPSDCLGDGDYLDARVHEMCGELVQQVFRPGQACAELAAQAQIIGDVFLPGHDSSPPAGHGRASCRNRTTSTRA